MQGTRPFPYVKRGHPHFIPQLDNSTVVEPLTQLFSQPTATFMFYLGYSVAPYRIHIRSFAVWTAALGFCLTGQFSSHHMVLGFFTDSTLLPYRNGKSVAQGDPVLRNQVFENSRWRGLPSWISIWAVISASLNIIAPNLVQIWHQTIGVETVNEHMINQSTFKKFISNHSQTHKMKPIIYNSNQYMDLLTCRNLQLVEFVLHMLSI